MFNREWADKFNSFNSDKGYLYGEHYQAIADWLKGERESPLPPIEVSLDPIHACNLMCKHCNAHRYLNNPKKMSHKHLMELIKFLAKWGVKAICFGGGGEPTMHPSLRDALDLSKDLGLENSLATNGTLLYTPLIETILYTCRWVGVSVDAATPETYKIGRKQNLFNDVIDSISALVGLNAIWQDHCDIGFKFLIFDYNQHEIFDACKLAKSLKVNDFHARPADFRHQGMGEFKKKQSGYDIKLIKRQFEKCHKLADKDFRVFTITHKYNSEDFTPRRNFTQCYASPICIQLCADGYVYLCPDTRQMPFFKLGRHGDIKRIWGSKKHKELVSKIGCQQCTSRCTFSPYNEICERLFINTDDPMCRNFV
jgi:MoaA/NifB/PqqE/SkfB family radical SAM enzyme